jgi:hypothetical protein
LLKKNFGFTAQVMFLQGLLVLVHGNVFCRTLNIRLAFSFFSLRLSDKNSFWQKQQNTSSFRYATLPSSRTVSQAPAMLSFATPKLSVEPVKAPTDELRKQPNASQNAFC